MMKLFSSKAENSAEPRFRIGSSSIIKEGKVEIRTLTTNVGLRYFKKRRLILQPTILSWITDREDFSSTKEVSKYDFPLPAARCITFVQSKDNRLILCVQPKMVLDDSNVDKVKDLVQREHTNILKEITLRFKDSEERDSWLRSFVSTCEKNYLRDVIFGEPPKVEDPTLEESATIGDEGFYKRAYHELWVRILLEWANMNFSSTSKDSEHSFKLNAVRKALTYHEGSAELKLTQQTLSRVLCWMDILIQPTDEKRRFKKEHAGIFVRFFIQAITNHAFRLLLFLFEPDNNFLQHFVEERPLLNMNIATPANKKVKDNVSVANNQSPALPSSRLPDPSLPFTPISRHSPSFFSPHSSSSSSSESSGDPTSPGIQISTSFLSSPSQSATPPPATTLMSSPISQTFSSKQASSLRGTRLDAIKQYLIYVEESAMKDVNLHYILYEKARHPLLNVSDLRNWPATSNASEEMDWNDHVHPDSLTWAMMSAVLRDPPFLPYKLIIKELKDVINDDTVESVVGLMENLPANYYSMSFNSLNINTSAKNGAHFLNLASFCKFREAWKIYGSKKLNLHFVNDDESSFLFADAVFRLIWSKMTSLKPRNLLRMFLLDNFDNESLKLIGEHSFLEVLHGIILIRLAQQNDFTMKVFRLANVKLPEDLNKYRGEKIEQLAFEQLKSLHFFSTRVVAWVEALVERPVGVPTQDAASIHAEVFIILWTLCCDSFLFRAFLFLVKPGPEMLAYFAHDAFVMDGVVDSEHETAYFFAAWMTERFKPLHSHNFRSFLFLFAHPFKDSFNHKEGFVHQYRWDEESKWMNEMVLRYGGAEQWTGFEIGYPELKKCLAETSFLTFQLCLCQSRCLSPLLIMKMMDLLPFNIVLSPFLFYLFNGSFTFHREDQDRRNNSNDTSITRDVTAFPPHYRSRGRYSAELDLFDNAHFKSLVNMYRLISAWDMISPFVAENPLLNDAVVSAFWGFLCQGREAEDVAFDRFFTPLVKSGHMFTFSDLIPLMLRNAVLDKNELITLIFKTLFPELLKSVLESSDISFVISEDLEAGLKGYLLLLANWTLKFLGIHGMEHLSRASYPLFGRVFGYLLRQSVANSSFRAMIACLEMEFGTAHKIATKRGEDVQIVAVELIKIFVKVASSESSDVSLQAIGYILHGLGHPISLYHEKTNSYSLKGVHWKEELEWMNHDRKTWIMSTRSFSSFLINPASLAFNYFVSNGNELSQLVHRMEYIPVILIKESFECYHEHLVSSSFSQSAKCLSSVNSGSNSNGASVTAVVTFDDRPITGRHFTSLFKQPIFQELWNLFIIPKMRPAVFLQRTYLLLWENVLAPDRVCKKMFHLAESRREIDLITFVNLLQCKLLAKLPDESSSVHHAGRMDQLLSGVDRIEIAEMRRIVEPSKSFLHEASLEPMIARIISWTQALCTSPSFASASPLLSELTADDATVFVELLEACIVEPFVRVFLFFFLPSTSLVSEFSLRFLGSKASQDSRQNAIKLIGYMLSAVQHRDWRNQRKAWTVFSYPKPDVVSGTCNPSWKEEAAWIEEISAKKDQNLRIGFEELRCYLTPSAALSYVLLTKVIHVKYRSEVMPDISPDYLISSFELPLFASPSVITSSSLSDASSLSPVSSTSVPGHVSFALFPGCPTARGSAATVTGFVSTSVKDYHFYYLCLLEHVCLGEASRKVEGSPLEAIFPVFLSYQLVNDLFIERIVKHAFVETNKCLQAAFEIIQALVLTTEDNEPKLNVRALCMFNNLSQVLIDALFVAANAKTILNSKVIMCQFFELLLILETALDCSKLPDLLLTSHLFKSQPVCRQKVSHASRVFSLSLVFLSSLTLFESSTSIDGLALLAFLVRITFV
jgi:hypothetical protein